MRESCPVHCTVVPSQHILMDIYHAAADSSMPVVASAVRNEEHWSMWLEVGFGGAAAVAAVYMCLDKLLQRDKRSRARLTQDATLTMPEQIASISQNPELPASQAESEAQSQDAQELRGLGGRVQEHIAIEPVQSSEE